MVKLDGTPAGFYDTVHECLGIIRMLKRHGCAKIEEARAKKHGQ